MPIYCRAHKASMFCLICCRAHMVYVFCLICCRANRVSMFCLICCRAHRASVFCLICCRAHRGVFSSGSYYGPDCRKGQNGRNCPLSLSSKIKPQNTSKRQ
ncbi:unnamed protein product [Prunus armeniaca]